MSKKIIGIVTDNIIGVDIAKRFSSCGYKSFVCICDDKDKINETKKVFLAKRCDRSDLHFSFDSKAFSYAIGDENAIVLFVKSRESYSVEFMDEFIDILPKQTIFGCSFRCSPYKVNEIFNYYSNKEVNLINLPILCSNQVADIGPVFLPCGDKNIYSNIQLDLENVAIKYENKPCVVYFPRPEIGNYCALVHDEAYKAIFDIYSDSISVFQKIFNYDNTEIHDLLLRWNDTVLKSGALVIIADIISKNDRETGKSIIEQVDGSRLTNKKDYSVEEMSECYYPNLSGGINIGKSLKHNIITDELHSTVEIKQLSQYQKLLFQENLLKACHVSIMAIYEQLFNNLADFFIKIGEEVDFSVISRAFYSGGMLTSIILTEFVGCFDKKIKPENLFSCPEIKRIVLNNIIDLRKVMVICIESSIYVGGFTAAIHYFDSMVDDNYSNIFMQLSEDYLFNLGYYKKGNGNLFNSNWETISGTIRSKENET